MLKAEGADIGNPAAQAIAWMHSNEVPNGFFYVGGIKPDTPRFKIEPLYRKAH